MRWRWILLALLVLVVAGMAWLRAVLVLPYRGTSGENVVVDIPRGTSTRSIARLLEEKRVVRSRIGFELLARWRGQTLEAGEYLFDHPMTSSSVFELIAQGRVWELTLTTPEGRTMFDIARQAERAGFGSSENFLRATRDSALIHDLAPEARSLEGFLFPATYHLPHRSTPEEVVAAMVQHFREVWSGLSMPERNPQGLSTLQVVTLASLVERETPRLEERPVIAGVFYNRLRLGYPLECDPTVIYALERANRYEGSLHADDLQIDSPYNTYRHAGLPPGPIANPGIDSLRAALNPPEVDYLYFVADAHGGHFFSRTLAEHNHNVALYRRLVAPAPAQPVKNEAKPRPKKARRKS